MAENELTTKQKQAIAALLSSRNVVEAAKAAHVGERSLYRWMNLPDFRAALIDAEGGAIDQATRRLIGLQNGAIDTLESVLIDSQTSAGVRLRAARAILDYLIKLRELRNLEERLINLESMVYGANNQ